MAGLSKTSRIGFVGSGMVGKSLALPYALQKGNVPEETAARMREMLASAHSDARPRDRE